MAALMGRAALRAVALAVAIALLARVLMRLVALDTLDVGRFSLAGTIGICIFFVISAVGAAVAGSLTTTRWVLVVVVLATSSLLWESDLAIGLSSFQEARGGLMTWARWLAFWSLFVAISALAVLTPYVGVRAGRRASLRA